MGSLKFEKLLNVQKEMSEVRGMAVGVFSNHEAGRDYPMRDYRLRRREPRTDISLSNI